MIRKCICDATIGTEEKPGRMSMMFAELYDKGFLIDYSSVDVNSFTATPYGFDGEITVTCNGYMSANITTGSKSTNNLFTSGAMITTLIFFYETQKRWLAIYAGNGNTTGTLSYWGQTDGGERVAFSCCSSNLANGVIFVDDLSKSNGQIITAQLPIKFDGKWGERNIFITDSTDNLLQTTTTQNVLDPETGEPVLDPETGEPTTETVITDSYVLGVQNVAMEGLNGFLNVPGICLFGWQYIGGKQAYLYTPLKINYDVEVDLTEEPEEE